MQSICFNNIGLTILTLHLTEFINAFVSINALHGSFGVYCISAHALYRMFIIRIITIMLSLVK